MEGVRQAGLRGISHAGVAPACGAGAARSGAPRGAALARKPAITHPACQFKFERCSVLRPEAAFALSDSIARRQTGLPSLARCSQTSIGAFPAAPARCRAHLRLANAGATTATPAVSTSNAACAHKLKLIKASQRAGSRAPPDRCRESIQWAAGTRMDRVQYHSLAL